MVTYFQILESKENRFIKQEELIKKYGYTLISFILNIPGPEKDNKLCRRIHKEGLKVIEEELNKSGALIYFKEIRYLVTGPEAFFSVDIDPMVLKNKMINIEENNPLGRIFDIDVFDKKHIQINRSRIGKGPRKCLLCDANAIDCIREKKHSCYQLISEIQEIAKAYGL